MAACKEPEPTPPNGGAGLVSQLLSNLRYKAFWMEASGALGDLGTFVPIVVALTLVNGLDLGTTLIFTGVYNILTGLLFGVPMPVQPMKSIAAVAIIPGHHLTIPQIMAAGLTTSGLLFVLGVTRLMGLVQRFMPLPVVRGIQLSQGLSFAITAIKYVMKKQDFAKDKAVGNREWFGLDGLLVALVAFCFIVVVTGSGESLVMHCEAPVQSQQGGGGGGGTAREGGGFRRRLEWVPTAMLVFAMGIVLTFLRRPSIAGELWVGPSKPQLIHISREDWKTGFLRAAVPQIPLSILNSVVAVCKLSNDLYPEKRKLVTPTSVSTSVGLMNLVGCWFGAMPVCHGAGGLAGQWRFGARSGAAVVMLGAGKVVLGMMLGSTLVKILAGYPAGILGVLLLYAGLELAMACRDQTQRGESFVVLGAAAVSIASANAALGFAFSLVVHMLLTLPDMQLAHVRAFVSSKFTKQTTPPPDERLPSMRASA